MRLIHLQMHKAIYLVWSADFFLLAACIILSDRSPIGKVNGKSSVNNNCAKRIYQPAIQKVNAQAPAACCLLSVNLSKKKYLRRNEMGGVSYRLNPCTESSHALSQNPVRSCQKGKCGSQK